MSNLKIIKEINEVYKTERKTEMLKVLKYIEDNLFDLFTSDYIHSDQALGLGLSVSKMIMQAHGGKIEFEKNSPSGLIVKLIIY